MDALSVQRSACRMLRGTATVGLGRAGTREAALRSRSPACVRSRPVYANEGAERCQRAFQEECDEQPIRTVLGCDRRTSTVAACGPATLGLELIDADSENGRIDLALATREDFTNPTGNVLGPIEE